MLTDSHHSLLEKFKELKEIRCHVGIKFWIARELHFFPRTWKIPLGDGERREQRLYTRADGENARLQCPEQLSRPDTSLVHKTVFTLHTSNLVLSVLFHEPLQLSKPTENHMLFFCGLGLEFSCCYALGFFSFSLVKTFLDYFSAWK